MENIRVIHNIPHASLYLLVWDTYKGNLFWEAWVFILMGELN